MAECRTGKGSGIFFHLFSQYRNRPAFPKWKAVFQNEKLKQNILQALPFWVASLITGIIAVLYAKLFALAEGFSFFILHWHGWLFFLLTPACFLTSWWVAKQFAPYSRGSGIPHVMAAIELATPKDNHRVNKLLNLRILLLKVVFSIVTVAGAAAGLAAAFNTPPGGIVFAVEELTKTHISYVKTAIFTAVIIAGLTAQALAGPYLYLGYPNVNRLSGFIFLALIPVAALAGLPGSGASKAMPGIFKWKSGFRSNRQHFFYFFCGSLAIAALACFINGQVLGSGKSLMTGALFTDNKYSPWYMPLLRIGGPLLSFTSGGSGGIFAPALSTGASIGSTVSGWMQLSAPNTNLLILVGMTAFLTGITHTPFTSAILVLEMTDRHNLIFHLMLAGMVASIAAIIIDKHSFYDHLKFQYLQELKEEDRLKTHDGAHGEGHLPRRII